MAEICRQYNMCCPLQNINKSVSKVYMSVLVTVLNVAQTFFLFSFSFSFFFLQKTPTNQQTNKKIQIKEVGEMLGS